VMIVGKLWSRRGWNCACSQSLSIFFRPSKLTLRTSKSWFDSSWVCTIWTVDDHTNAANHGNHTQSSYTNINHAYSKNTTRGTCKTCQGYATVLAKKDDDFQNLGGNSHVTLSKQGKRKWWV
jgi:hypothetical protein